MKKSTKGRKSKRPSSSIHSKSSSGEERPKGNLFKFTVQAEHNFIITPPGQAASIEKSKDDTKMDIDIFLS